MIYFCNMNKSLKHTHLLLVLITKCPVRLNNYVGLLFYGYIRAHATVSSVFQATKNNDNYENHKKAYLSSKSVSP